MTRGDAEFRDYVQSLQERENSGQELTEAEKDWLAQGKIAGAV